MEVVKENSHVSNTAYLLIGDGRILKFISEIDEGLELVPADTSVVIRIGTSESFPSSESRDHGTQFSKRLFELCPGEELIVIGIAIQEMLPQLLLTQGSGLRLSMSWNSFNNSNDGHLVLRTLGFRLRISVVQWDAQH
ncbi:hypothetical protein V6N13_065663 [Hibiscus sabdariffa]